MLWRKRYRPESEEKLKAKWDKLSLEKEDIPAMILAALITLLPAVLLVGGIFLLAVWFMFLK